MTVPGIGDVIEVDDHAFRYGSGKLILQITRIGGRTRAADGEWLDLEGFELWADGTQVAPQPRHASVRIDAVHVRGGSAASG